MPKLLMSIFIVMKSPGTVLNIVFGATLLMLFVIFKGSIDQWIGERFALDISNAAHFYAERIVFAQILFVAAVLGLFSLWFTQYKIIIAGRHFLLSIGVALFYLLAYRPFPDTLEFELLSISESGILAKVYFADLILLGTFLVIIQGVSRYFLLTSLRSRFKEWLGKRKKKNTEKSKKEIVHQGFLYDDPITDRNNDQLGYKDYAPLIAQRIINTPLGADGSFAIGINGKWGIGKTSLLRFIKEDLESNSNIVIDFSPWTNKNADHIIEDFFTTLRNRLACEHTGVASLMDDYAEKLADANIDYISKVVGIFKSKRSVANLKEDINTAIKEIGKRLVIIIDDLDRLDKAEVVEILKLIRNNGDFANTFYIVAYDKNYLREALKELNQHEPATYLEKIFQVEFKLPLYPNSSIQKLIEEKLGTALGFNQDEVSTGVKQIMTPTIWRNCYLTPRDSNRLANAVSTNLERIRNEVDLGDFLLIEIIRLKFPELHLKLMYQRDELLEVVTGTHYEIREKIDEKLELILKSIFPRKKRENQIPRNSVTRIKSYHKYFRYDVFPDELSITTYLSLFGPLSEEELAQKVETIALDGRLDDFIFKLHNIKQDDNDPSSNKRKLDIYFILNKHALHRGFYLGKQMASTIEDLMAYERSNQASERNYQTYLEKKIEITDTNTCLALADLFNAYRLRRIKHKSILFTELLNIDEIKKFDACLNYYLENIRAFDNHLCSLIQTRNQFNALDSIGLPPLVKQKLFSLISSNWDAFILEVVTPVYANTGTAELLGVGIAPIVKTIFQNKEELVQHFNQEGQSELLKEFSTLIGYYDESLEKNGYVPVSSIGKRIPFAVSEKFKGQYRSDFEQIMDAIEEYMQT
jgi:hypothetical protein